MAMRLLVTWVMQGSFYLIHAVSWASSVLKWRAVCLADALANPMSQAAAMPAKPHASHLVTVCKTPS